MHTELLESENGELVEVKKGVPTVIKIEKVEFPPNSICIMLARMRHALGAVLEISRYVEKVRWADQVIFLPICDGVVKKGDLLGVVNVIYIKTVKKSKILHILAMDVDELIKSKDWPFLFQ